MTNYLQCYNSKQTHIFLLKAQESSGLYYSLVLRRYLYSATHQSSYNLFPSLKGKPKKEVPLSRHRPIIWPSWVLKMCIFCLEIQTTVTEHAEFAFQQSKASTAQGLCMLSVKLYAQWKMSETSMCKESGYVARKPLGRQVNLKIYPEGYYSKHVGVALLYGRRKSLIL